MVGTYKPVTVVLRGASLARKAKGLERDPRIQKTHQALRLLLDSPLSKSDKLRIYVHTTENVLVELSHLIDIPGDCEEFNNLMSYLLRRLVVKAGDGTVLAKVVKNPVTSYLPPNSTKMGLSAEGRQVPKEELASSVQRGFVFFVDMEAREEKDVEFDMKLSDFELSIGSCCVKLTSVFEELLEIF